MRAVLIGLDDDVADNVLRLVKRHLGVCRAVLPWDDPSSLPVDTAALIVGVREGENGVDLIDRIRRYDHSLPMLAICHHIDARLVNELHALRCEIVAAPFRSANILGFAEECVERFMRIRQGAIGWDDLAMLYCFSPRERELLSIVVQTGAPPREVCALMGIGYSTFRTLRSRVVRKSMAPDFQTLCCVLRTVMQHN